MLLSSRTQSAQLWSCVDRPLDATLPNGFLTSREEFHGGVVRVVGIKHE